MRPARDVTVRGYADAPQVASTTLGALTSRSFRDAARRLLRREVQATLRGLTSHDALGEERHSGLLGGSGGRVNEQAACTRASPRLTASDDIGAGG